MSLVVVVVPAMAAYVATSADPANDADRLAAAVGGAAPHCGCSGRAASWSRAVPGSRSSRSASPRSWCSPPTPRRAAPRAAVGAWPGSPGSPGRGGRRGGGGRARRERTARCRRGRRGAHRAGRCGRCRDRLGLGLARDGAPGAWLAPRVAAVPAWLRVAVRMGLGVPAMLLAAASVVVLTWVMAGQAATGDVIDALGTDVFGGAMLAVAQLGLLPNLVVWAVSWLTGTGFAVGAGTMFAPDRVLGGPMPALPLLGALPTQAGGLLTWAPVVVVVVGASRRSCCTVGCRRTRRGSRWPPWSLRPCVAGVVAGALAALSGGPAGPGRMAVVGPAPLRVALDTVALVLPGLAAGGAGIAAGARGGARAPRHDAGSGGGSSDG